MLVNVDLVLVFVRGQQRPAVETGLRLEARIAGDGRNMRPGGAGTGVDEGIARRVSGWCRGQDQGVVLQRGDGEAGVVGRYGQPLLDRPGRA